MKAKQLNYYKYKGVTLIEALIAVTILSFLLAVIYRAYVPSMGHFKRVNEQTMTEQQALTAYQRMFRDLVLSNINSVTITNNPTKSISFLSTDDLVSTTNGPALTADDLLGYDTTNTVPDVSTEFSWKKFVIVYPGSAMAGNRRIYTLLKKEVPYFNSSPENTGVLRIKNSKVNEIINNSAYPVYILARGITDINFQMPGKYITIELVSIQVSDRSRTGDQDFFESSRYIFNITPRN